MKRAVVNVATGRYVTGQRRLKQALEHEDAGFIYWTDVMPPNSPSHTDVPYAFKAWALHAAVYNGYETLLWADASIVPIKPLGPLWESIERDGYWFSNNGWTNYEWTCESAYEHLGIVPEENRTVPHVVATAFGLNLKHELGQAFFLRYLEYAENGAFRGPWWNKRHPDYRDMNDARCAPCGPDDVRGHRHDQTAASVIAWRLRMKLTNPPEYFAYRGGETEATYLVADGSF